MNQAFDITTQNRKVLSTFLKNYSLEQLNKVPDGFNNNMIWNIAHIIVVQQLLVYKLSGFQPMISSELISKYSRGTKPEVDVTEDEVEEIKGLLFKTIEQTKTDFENSIFKEYHEFTNDLGFTLSSIEEAISFNNFHEAVHLGMIMSIRKFV